MNNGKLENSCMDWGSVATRTLSTLGVSALGGFCGCAVAVGGILFLCSRKKSGASSSSDAAGMGQAIPVIGIGGAVLGGVSSMLVWLLCKSGEGCLIKSIGASVGVPLVAVFGLRMFT